MKYIIQKYPDFQYIIKADRQELILKLLVATCCIIVGCWLLIFFGFPAPTWLIPAAILILLVSGGRLMLDVINCWKTINSPTIKLLFYKPQSIVWVYSVVTQHMPFGIQFLKSGTLILKTIDNEEFQIRLDGEVLPSLTESLRSWLPHATFGFSQEKEQWYMANPALLIADDYDGELED